MQKVTTPLGSGGKTLPTTPLAPMDIPNLQLSRSLGSGSKTLRPYLGSRTFINDTPPQGEHRMHATNLSAEQHWQEVYNTSERNLVGALMRKAGQYKASMDTAYDEEVGAVKEEARAEVAQVHQQAEHFAAIVVEGAEMYTTGIRADAQRTVETGRQATFQAAEKTIQQNKNEVVPEAQRIINHEKAPS